MPLAAGGWSRPGDDVIFGGDSLLAVDTNGQGVGGSSIPLKPDV